VQDKSKALDMQTCSITLHCKKVWRALKNKTFSHHNTEIKLHSMRLGGMETHLNIVHDHILVPRPAQSAAIMAQLEEASLLWGF